MEKESVTVSMQLMINITLAFDKYTITNDVMLH